MSAIKAAVDDITEHLRAAATKLKELGHEGWARVEEILHELEGDAPKIEAQAEQDVKDVAQSAATQGVEPAVAKAEADGVTLIEDAGRDVAAAVEGSAEPVEPETPSTTPAQTTAVIAGETAVAEQPSA